MYQPVKKSRQSFHQLMRLVSVASTILLMMASPANAYDTDEALEMDGQLCTHQISRGERMQGIPQRLLASIAATESGRWHKGLGMAIPWPWTINVEGAGYYYHSKDEAITAVQNFRQQGKRSIDVGCMQVNLVHHPDAFATLDQAFDPKYNVEYAAEFLRGNYDATGSWKTAVGHYHSKTSRRANAYIDRVYRQWYGLSNGKAPQFASTRKQQPRKRYTTFIRVADPKHDTASTPEVKQVTFTKAATPKANNVRKAVKVSDVSDDSARVVRVASAVPEDVTATKQQGSAKVVTTAAPMPSQNTNYDGPVQLKEASRSIRPVDGGSGSVVLNALEPRSSISLTDKISAASNDSSLQERDDLFIQFAQ